MNAQNPKGNVCCKTDISLRTTHCNTSVDKHVAMLAGTHMQHARQACKCAAHSWPAMKHAWQACKGAAAHAWAAEIIVMYDSQPKEDVRCIMGYADSASAAEQPACPTQPSCLGCAGWGCARVFCGRQCCEGRGGVESVSSGSMHLGRQLALETLQGSRSRVWVGMQ